MSIFTQDQTLQNQALESEFVEFKNLELEQITGGCPESPISAYCIPGGLSKDSSQSPIPDWLKMPVPKFPPPVPPLL